MKLFDDMQNDINAIKSGAYASFPEPLDSDDFMKMIDEIEYGKSGLI